MIDLGIVEEDDYADQVLGLEICFLEVFLVSYVAVKTVVNAIIFGQ